MDAGGVTMVVEDPERARASSNSVMLGKSGNKDSAALGNLVKQNMRAKVLS